MNGIVTFYYIVYSESCCLPDVKEDKYNVIIPMSDIYLSAPQDGAIIDLNDLSIEE